MLLTSTRTRTSLENKVYLDSYLFSPNLTNFLILMILALVDLFASSKEQGEGGKMAVYKENLQGKLFGLDFYARLLSVRLLFYVCVCCLDLFVAVYSAVYFFEKFEKSFLEFILYTIIAINFLCTVSVLFQIFYTVKYINMLKKETKKFQEFVREKSKKMKTGRSPNRQFLQSQPDNGGRNKAILEDSLNVRPNFDFLEIRSNKLSMQQEHNE